MGAAADLLLRARRRAGLTQAELARRAGIPRSVLNVYERGKREPGADTLAAILAAAGFEIRLGPRIDLDRNARRLTEVLDLAEQLPARRRDDTITYPPFRRRTG